MVDQPRPIWLTGKQHNELARIYALQPPAVITEILAAWDAAPADAAEAVRAVFRDWYGVPVSGVQMQAVLRALGMPDA